jgi:hypothetical protein
MSQHKWKIGPVKLIAGNDAVIYRFCGKRNKYIGELTGVFGGVYAAEWNIAGEHTISGIGDPMLNLAPIPKKKVRVIAAFNVYPDGTFSHHYNREQADRGAGSTRIACKEIDIEVEEGEGL